MNTSSCPGSQARDFRATATADAPPAGPVKSELTHWPVQMHLISPTAPYYEGADVLLAADCTGYALGGFHPDFLKGKSIGIACPKLDEGQEEYVAKIKSWIDDAKINTLTVMIMQVPCCRGLLALAQEAARQATRKVPIKVIVAGVQGEVIAEEWATA
jgi:hypothetical protein